MYMIREDEPLASAAVRAIRTGDVPALKRLLADHPELAAASVARSDSADGETERRSLRTLLHVATDWPGRFPNVAATIAALIEAGADANAGFVGPHAETPLHWAASCDDVEAIDALLGAGADIEAPGAVIAGGTPLDDAVAFGQWRAARRLVERGARTALWHASALGLLESLKAHFAGAALSNRYPWGAGSSPPPNEIDVAFWCACHGGQRHCAEYLLSKGADPNWVSAWDGLTPLDAALRGGADELAEWLRGRGARPSGASG